MLAMAEIEISPDIKDHRDQQVALTIAILAILLAVISSLGQGQSNERIVQQIEASNGFAWYQAKRIRSGMNELLAEQMKIAQAGTTTAAQNELITKLVAQLSGKTSEYEKESEKILQKAEFAKSLAARADTRGTGYGRGEIFLQVAVVFCSITLLTKTRAFFYSGVLFAVLGLGLGLVAFVS